MRDPCVVHTPGIRRSTTSPHRPSHASAGRRPRRPPAEPDRSLWRQGSQLRAGHGVPGRAHKRPTSRSERSNVVAVASPLRIGLRDVTDGFRSRVNGAARAAIADGSASEGKPSPPLGAFGLAAARSAIRGASCYSGRRSRVSRSPAERRQPMRANDLTANRQLSLR